MTEASEFDRAAVPTGAERQGRLTPPVVADIARTPQLHPIEAAKRRSD